jgi:phosphorylated CTD-interacting factor 1
MPKIKKRKRSVATERPNVLYNLTGANGGQQGDDSIDDLMAEFEGSSSGGAAFEEKSKPTTISNQQPDTANVEQWDFSEDVMKAKSKDQALTWNNSLRIWIKNGKYSESLLPNFDLELARHFQVEKLSKFLLKSADDLKMPTFERWLLDSKLEEERVLDPVLPMADLSTGASQRLVKELSQKLASAKAEEVVQDLCRHANSALQELTVLQRRTAKKSPLGKGDRIDMEQDRRDEDGMKALLYTRKSWKKPYCIKLNETHYSKLKAMYERVHGSIESSSKGGGGATHAFHLIVMALCLRYSSLSGGQLLNDLRGGGMQGAIQPHVFRTLQHQVFGEACVEAFASPLNAYYPQFGSAFPDLDWHFGSVGDFFDKKFFEQGCYEANPPFSPGLMMKMARTMQERLARADKKDKALTFVVVVPSAANTEGSRASLAKDFANKSFALLDQLSAKHYVLKSREHGYVEGAQHIKPTRYKQSGYDTSVFILQSKVAAIRVNLDERGEVEEQIRTAFSSKHEEEIQQRKERQPPASEKKHKPT